MHYAVPGYPEAHQSFGRNDVDRLAETVRDTRD